MKLLAIFVVPNLMKFLEVSDYQNVYLNHPEIPD